MANMLMFFGAMIFFLCFPIFVVVGGAMACDKAMHSNPPQKAKVVRVRGFYGTCIGYARSRCNCGKAGNFGTSVQIDYKQYKNCPRCGILLDWDNIVEEKKG